MRLVTATIKQDYQTGLEILNMPFREYDNNSVITEMNVNQKAFLIHSELEFTSPDQKWRWDGVRPTVRNKVLSLAAQLTAQVLVPNIFAQNRNDQEDKQVAEVMRLILEWNIRNSDYDITFLNGVIAALVNPVAYFGVEFLEAIQIVKTKSKGKFKTKEVVDEFLSGLQVSNVPLDEILITNAYEYNLQKQRAIMRNKFPEYSELEKIFGKHKNWRFITPGIRTVFSDVDSTFYDQKDESLDTLADYLVYQNRGDDFEIPYINGVDFGDDSENPLDGNPIKHRDQLNRPKYPYVKFGAEPIDEKNFYFYKSIASKMMPDFNLSNKVWRITVDTGTLGLKPPLTVSGDKKLETDVYYPGSVVNAPRDTKFGQLPVGNEASGYNLLQALDNEISESTQDPFRQGISRDLPNTAFQQAQLTQNAKIQLGPVGKVIIQAIRDLGGLMVDDIIHHQTVGEVSQLMDGGQRLKFKNFLFPNQTEEGKTLTKEVRFTDELIGAEMTDEQIKEREFNLLEEEGGIDGERRIMLVNPNLFRKMRFMIFIDADSLLPLNEAFESAEKLDAYSKAILNPLVAQDAESMRAVTADLLFGALRSTKNNVDKYLPKRPVPLVPAGQENTPRRVPVSERVMKSKDAGSLSELMIK